MQYRIKNIPEKIDVSIHLPASKSISNRLQMISALSGGKVQIEGLSESDDSQIMKALLASGDRVRNAGHAGTTMRFLTAFFAAGKEEIILTGSERMKERPISELVLALQSLGANIEYIEKEGFPPLMIKGKRLSGGKLIMRSNISSQYISAILMIAPLLEGGLELELSGEILSASYIDMTLSLMKMAGARAEMIKNRIFIEQGPYSPCRISVEPDWSSASYWFMIAGMHPDARIFLRGLNKESLQGDSGIVSIFEKIGVQTEFSNAGITVHKSPKKVKVLKEDFASIPDMVQSFVPFCVAEGIPFHFTGCKSLRIKETDRISALHKELKRFGTEISFSPDGDQLWWDGSSKPGWSKNVTISTYKDHRMALGMSTLAIKCGEIAIDDPLVVTKSYPGFWNDIRKAGFLVEE